MTLAFLPNWAKRSVTFLTRTTAVAAARVASWRALASAILLLLGPATLIADETPASTEDTGFEVPDGFEVTLFADDSLAHNIYSMTFDSQGRLVVSGPGYVRRLVDDDRDGCADRSETFCEGPATGAQGMCFVGDDLICTADGSLLRYRDDDRDSVADGSPQRWTALKNSEHGAHAIIQGPDGWLYAVCGNDAGVSRDHVRHVGSPVQAPRCGAILRVSTDGKQFEVLADGFRNSYDLAFHAAGNLFTVDSDGERDHHLPWYTPTRLFDVAAGRSHGWMHDGHQRSWNRPESFADNVDRVAELGRGSPTGLVCYQHTSFPERYREGIFSACWTLGRIYFMPLAVEGATYRAVPEIFMRTTGNVGFAPCDLEVSPSGDLFVAIGGRQTRGGVFRIRYIGGSTRETLSAFDEDALTLDGVLDSPQPFSSWSRARWKPAAEQLGAEELLVAVNDTSAPTARRVRAVEILVELFGGLPLDVAGELARERDATLVARVAWAVGLNREDVAARQLLAGFTAHADPRVMRAAWEGLARQKSLSRDLDPAPHWLAGLASSDRRVRAATVACGERAGRVSFAETMHRQTIGAIPDSLPPRVQLSRLWIERPQATINRDWSERCVRTCRDVFDRTTDAELRLEAVRLMQFAVGDIKLGEAGPELAVGYEAGKLVAVPDVLRLETGGTLAGRFPTGHAELDRELARLLAMLRCKSPMLPEAIATRWSKESSVPDDVHYLMVMAQLSDPREPTVSRATSAALLALDVKLTAGGLFVSRNWPERVQETFDRLVANDNTLVAAILADTSFGRAGHSMFVLRMPKEMQVQAARRLLEVARSADVEDATAWTAELVDVLAYLPPDEVYPALREQTDNFAVRDAVVAALAEHPQSLDRERFVESLSSPQADAVERAAGALLQLDSPVSPREIARAIMALRQLTQVAPAAAMEMPIAGALGEPVEAPFRRQRMVLTSLLRHWTGKDLGNSSSGVAGTTAADSDRPSEVLDAWMTWFAETYPDEAAQLSPATGVNVSAWQARLAGIDWTAADAERGAKLFERATCHRCHVGANRLGPDLAGAADRLSREDLVAALVDPSRDVSPLYRTTLVGTHDGNVYHGLVVYDSPEGLLLQTGPDTTIRVTGEELAVRQESTQSLMPTGLLDSFTNEEVADLYAYLKTLRPK